MTLKRTYILVCGLLAAGLLIYGCQPERPDIIPEPVPQQDTTQTAPPEPQKPAGPVIPDTLKSLPCVYIETPNHAEVASKEIWVEPSTIKITGDGGEVLFEQDSLKIRGRGNSTWVWFDKKPYYIKLSHKADLLGTGKSRKWVLSANWMDRTLLRHHVAFEAARRTSLDWTPSGRFVELYLNGEHLGNYWLGEKINVEGSKFTADYLYSFDTSDKSEEDFISYGTYRAFIRSWGTPVEVKYPDRDDYLPGAFATVLSQASSTLDAMTDAIAAGKYADVIDVDSFCDWYLVHELCYNQEPNHPKSCFFHWKNGKMYAGPVWDFDWGTFTPEHNSLLIRESLWFGTLLADASFVSRLKQRWATLKPSFETLGDYIDEQADLIRESEAVNHRMWPCYPNPLSEDGSGMVNHDEQLSFQQAVDRMKSSLSWRISAIDKRLSEL